MKETLYKYLVSSSGGTTVFEALQVMIIALIFALTTSCCNSASTVSMETSQEIEISDYTRWI